MQNSDGGFGISNKYESDVYDTLLVLEAFISLNKEEYNKSIDKMLSFILKMQNTDGGWSYNNVNASDKVLTIRVVYNILLYINTNQISEENIEPILSKAGVFLDDVKNTSVNEENIELKMYYELINIINEDYTYIEKFISELSDLQNSNGSFYENYYYTYLVIKYLNSIGDIDKLYMINTMSLNLSKIYFEVNTSNEVIGDYEILYDTVTDKELKLITRIYNDKNIVYSQENKLILNKEENVVNGTAFSYKFNEMKEKTFLVEVYLYDDNEILISTSDYFKVCDSSEKQFILEADKKTGEDYGISLLWNDLSGENEKYGYRVLRSEDGGVNWETRSSWDGLEKVKVLNIYPSATSENYVKDWMNTIVDEEKGEVAGKRLIEVETVLIDDYVNNADYYMKNENGDYIYDVLFFGAADSNNSKDLNYKSQQSVQKFIDSGRGVLFGHDTICSSHTYFNYFTNQLGIKTIYQHSNRTTSVSVVKEGFITSFPWSVTGNLTVPQVHSSGQFGGGILEGTVWMRLNTSGITTDYITGARDDAYLVTNNQLGFIQTGHSNGQATQDECKVLANTLFYLKQYTQSTSATDNSFYDTAKPLKPEVKLSLSECDKDKYSIKATISSKDLGSAYKYKVQALPKSDRTVPVNSNIIEAEAFSGLKGYVVIKTNSEVSAIDKISYDDEEKIIVDIAADIDGTAEYEVENIDKIKKNYLHIFAIDNADNISEEYIYNLENSYEEFGATKVTTTISSDKTSYNVGEITQLIVSAKSDFHNINATGVVEIYDSENILVDTVESVVNMEITSDNLTNIECEWNVENIVTGKYKASVKWYYGNNLISEDRTEFNVIPNGKITDIICADKKIYTMEDKIKLTDNVYNDTANIFEDNLELIIDIYEEGKEENSVKKSLHKSLQ